MDILPYKLEALQKIIGQDHVIEKVLIALFKHYLKLTYDLEVNNSPLLLIGETGTGKTFTVKTICKSVNIPFIELNGKSINQEGWAGRSFLQHIEDHKSLLDNDMPYAVIFIDEFDKMCIPNTTSNGENNALQLQAGLLKYIEGSELNNKYDTKYFCFIFAGAFSGIDVHKKTFSKNIGFHRQDNYELDLNEELLNYGIIPELIGRIKDIVIMNPLTKEMLEAYIKLQHNILGNWKTIQECSSLDISQDYIDKSIDIALKKNLGIRGLEQEIEKALDEHLIKNYLR